MGILNSYILTIPPPYAVSELLACVTGLLRAVFIFSIFFLEILARRKMVVEVFAADLIKVRLGRKRQSISNQ